MKKIKILRIIARLNIGGPAVHTIILTEGLDKEKFESLLVCGNTDKNEGNMLYYARSKNISPLFILTLKRELDFFSDLGAFVKIYNIIKKEKPDIIHTHTAKAGALGRLAGIIYNFLHPFNRKIRLIHTFHGHIFEGYFNKLRTSFFIIIEKILSLFTSKIITVSEAVKEELVALHIAARDKIEVIRLGLEIDKFLSLPLKENVVTNIGIVGRLVPIKNHKLFLEAAAKVISDNPDMQLRFKIIGDGELRKGLEEYSGLLGISGRLDFLGWQSDLVNIYSDLDIVTLTSKNEGTPVSLIEAMASGNAVVATDVGGIRDLFGAETDKPIEAKAGFEVLERGIIVDEGNSFGFAAGLNYILRNGALRKNMEEKARSFVKDKFDKSRLIRDIEDLYERMIYGKEKF